MSVTFEKKNVVHFNVASVIIENIDDFKLELNCEIKFSGDKINYSKQTLSFKVKTECLSLSFDNRIIFPFKKY